MGWLLWILGFFSKVLMSFVFLIGIIVMLDAAAHTVNEEKQNLGWHVGRVKLAGEGLKGGAAKKNKKKKRVEFADDAVEVRKKKANDVELSGKLVIKDVELCEKVGILGDSSDRAEDITICNIDDVVDVGITEDVDDVVVAGIFFHLDGSHKPIEVFEDMSAKVGFSEGSLGSKVVMEDVHEFEAKGDAYISGENSTGECSDANMIQDVKSADGSKNVGVQVDEALCKEVAEEKKEGGIIGDCTGVKGADVTNNIRAEECSDVAGERVVNHATFWEQDSETKALDSENGDFRSDAAIRGRMVKNIELLEEALERQAVYDEDGMLLTDIIDNVVGKRLTNNGEGLEEELNKTAVDGQNGITTNDVVRTNETETAVGESVAGKAEFLDEELEKETVEEKCEKAAGDLDKICGGKEDNIPLVTSGLENLVVEEAMNGEESSAENNVELICDNVACPLEVGRVETELKEVEGATMRERGNDDSGNNDDDWEGIERSELEKVFAEAVNYVEYGWKTKKDDQSASLRSDVRMLLYGLHKLAVEGPCHLPQPMALKVTARAKWNAWRNLGSMSPEAAMEQYIKVLSDANPGWTQYSAAVSFSVQMNFWNYIAKRLHAHPTGFTLLDDATRGSLENGAEGCPDEKLTSYKHPKANFEQGRKPEMSSLLDGNSLIEHTP